MRLSFISKKDWLICFIALIIVLFNTSVFGEESGGVLIVPARLEAIFNYDGSIPSLYVINNSNSKIDLEVSYGWGTHDLYGQPRYLDSSNHQALIIVYPSSFTLNSKEIMEVKVSVNPSDQPMYPVIFFDFISQGDMARKAVRIAVPLLLTPSGFPEGEGVITHCWLERKGKSLIVNLIFANPNMAHVRSGGKVMIVHKESGISFDIDIPKQIILPGAQRLVSIEWYSEESIRPGIYLLEIVGFPVQTVMPKFIVDVFHKIHIYSSAAPKLIDVK
jgi:hypothetical protein